MNIQNPGITYAIWGPFKRFSERRQRQMAVAAPPKELAPQVSGELAEVAQRYGMSTLEAAAYDRLGGWLAWTKGELRCNVTRSGPGSARPGNVSA